jgi:hypothetical protein
MLWEKMRESMLLLAEGRQRGLRLANSDCGTRHSRLLAADIAPICPSQSAFV